jgi:hypothetical protein
MDSDFYLADQRLGRGLEQEVIDHRLVVVGDVGDGGRQREDHVEVGYASMSTKS